MDVSQILKPECVVRVTEVGSKKHALDLLSQSLAKVVDCASQGEILDCLVARERLGSTGLGEAVAMPHSRIAGLAQSAGAFLKLDTPIDFEASDNVPVDMLFALLVPENCESDHIDQIRDLIKKLRDPNLRRLLHEADDPDALYGYLTDSLTAIHRTITV